MPITIATLPHEIVLRIVEWTDVLARAERTRRLLAEEEEAAHMAAHHGHGHGHDHGLGDEPPLPFVGEDDAAGGPQGAVAGAGLGGPEFMANLFGMFNNVNNHNNAGPQPGANGNGNAAGPGNATGNPGLGAGVAAGGPGGLFGTLMQALGAQPGQGLPAAPADEETDEEMPGRLVTPFDAPQTRLSDGVQDLEPLPGAANTLAPAVTATTPANPAATPPISSNGPATTVAADADDEAIPSLESFGSPNPAVLEHVVPSSAAETDQTPTAEGSEPMDAQAQSEGQQIVPASATSTVPPFTPATPSVSDSLAQEVEQNVANSQLTPLDLMDIPDLTSPTDFPPPSTLETVQEGESDEWEDAESSEDGDAVDALDDSGAANGPNGTTGSNADANDEDDEVEDEDDDELDDDDENLDDGDTGTPELETSPTWVDPETFTYKDGLPEDPILPLAFVNRSFLNAVRTILYGRALTITDMYQASRFLESLKAPIVSIADVEPEADDDELRKRGELAYLVRQIIFDVRKTISLGRGGGNVVLDILALCPRVEVLILSMDWTQTALVPLTTALKAATGIKSISLRSGLPEKKELVWDMRKLEPLLSTWTELDDLQFSWIKTAEGPFKPLAGHITKLSLAHCDLRDSDVQHILANSKDVLKVFEVHLPSDLMTRRGLAQALKENGANLESLHIDVSRTWHQRHATAAIASTSALTPEQAAGTRYLMDGLVGYLPKLKELKLSGSLASTVMIARLPKSLNTLALEDNLGVDVRKLVGLFKKTRKVKSADSSARMKTVPAVLPKLKCFTYARSDGLRPADPLGRELERLMKQRKACMHWTYTGRNGPAGKSLLLGQ